MNASLCRPLLAALLIVWLGICHRVLADAPEPDGEAPDLITLRSGHAIAGSLLPSPARNVIRWQGVDFSRPFEFQSDGVSTIRFRSRPEFGDDFKVPAGLDSAGRFLSSPTLGKLFLISGQTITGRVDTIDQRDWILSVGPDRVVRVPRSSVRSMLVLRGGEVAPPVGSPPGRIGRLVTDRSKSIGRIVPWQSDRSGDDAVWAWQPLASSTASPMSADASGQIVYRSVATSTLQRNNQARATRLKMGSDFGQLFLQRLDDSGRRSRSAVRNEHVVHLLSGDIIGCHVDSIDEQFVRISVDGLDTEAIRRGDVKAVELIENATPLRVSDPKRQRLLTLTRQESDHPPTHLLVAVDGDLLRCRLISMDREVVRVELLGRTVSIPRSRVVQIVDLESDRIADSTELPEPRKSDGGLIQIADSGGRRITIRPTQVSSTEVIGQSSRAGTCRMSFSDLDQWLFGAAIREGGKTSIYADWRLQPGEKPLVDQAAAPESP